LRTIALGFWDAEVFVALLTFAGGDAFGDTASLAAGGFTAGFAEGATGFGAATTAGAFGSGTFGTGTTSGALGATMAGATTAAGV
jgi:hypothetical protein